MEQWREDVLIHYGVKGMKWRQHLRNAYDRIRDPYYQKRLERSARAYEATARRSPGSNAAGNASKNLKLSQLYNRYAKVNKGGTVNKVTEYGKNLRVIQSTGKAYYDTDMARKERVRKADKAYARKEAARNTAKKAKKTVRSVLNKFGIK